MFDFQKIPESEEKMVFQKSVVQKSRLEMCKLQEIVMITKKPLCNHYVMQRLQEKACSMQKKDSFKFTSLQKSSQSHNVRKQILPTIKRSNQLSAKNLRQKRSPIHCFMSLSCNARISFIELLT